MLLISFNVLDISLKSSHESFFACGFLSRYAGCRVGINFIFPLLYILPLSLVILILSSIRTFADTDPKDIIILGWMIFTCHLKYGKHFSISDSSGFLLPG